MDCYRVMTCYKGLDYDFGHWGSSTLFVDEQRECYAIISAEWTPDGSRLKELNFGRFSSNTLKDPRIKQESRKTVTMKYLFPQIREYSRLLREGDPSSTQEKRIAKLEQELVRVLY